jgi:hypothetical protein
VIGRTVGFNIYCYSYSKVNFNFCFRFGRLVLLLPLLRMIRVETVEVLLFRETVGETGINNIILDVYNSHRLPLL